MLVSRITTQAASGGRAASAIPSLTGIRGVAASWVFLTHFQDVCAAYFQSPAIDAMSFFRNGFRGIDLFFVLSGFILMHVHAGEFARLTRPALRDFYVLRFFRIYPFNAVVLLALLPIGLGMPQLVAWFRTDHGMPIPYHSHDFSAAGFVQTLFLAQTWTLAKLGEWNGPSWTLSAEVVGYALFPLLAHRLVQARTAAGCVAVAVASLVVLMVLLAAFGHAHDNPTGSFGLVRMLFAFAAGMCLARALQLWPAGANPGQAMTLGALLFIAACLAIPAANMLVVFGFAALILGLAFRSGPVNRVMESRAALFMGRISFSFYLIHYIPLKLSMWALAIGAVAEGTLWRMQILALLVALCVALAMLTHRYVELPFQRLARRMQRAAPAYAANAPRLSERVPGGVR